MNVDTFLTVVGDRSGFLKQKVVEDFPANDGALHRRIAACGGVVQGPDRKVNCRMDVIRTAEDNLVDELARKGSHSLEETEVQQNRQGFARQGVTTDFVAGKPISIQQAD